MFPLPVGHVKYCHDRSAINLNRNLFVAPFDPLPDVGEHKVSALVEFIIL